MTTAKAYEEVIDFIAAGNSPDTLIAFRPSEAARARVLDLVSHEKSGSLTPEETSELEHYLQVEHIMRLARARAWQHLQTA